MKKDLVDSLMRETVDVLTRSPLSKSDYIDIILLLVVWKYASDNGLIKPDHVLAAAARKSDALIYDVVHRLEEQFKIKDFGSASKKEAQDFIKALIGIWDTSQIRIGNREPEEQETVAIVFDWITEFLGQNEFGTAYVTPKDIVNLISSLIDPLNANSSVYDPNCRSGNLLLSMADKMGAKRIEGEVRDQASFRIAKIHSILSGGKANIMLGHHSTTSRKQFDVIVTNPPFGVTDILPFEPRGKWADEFRTKRSDITFLTHVLDSLTKEGRAFVVMPYHFLFSTAQIYQLRRAMIQENLIESIIYLPSKVFYGTSVAAEVIVIKKSRTRDEILLSDMSSLGLRVGNLTRLSSEEIELVSSTYQAFVDKPSIKSFDNQIFRILSHEEILERDFDLQFNTYKSQSPNLKFRESKEILKECREIEEELKAIQASFKFII